ncbi:hypothetical protein AB0H76_19835 [Nocardia sp. NPDC050712]|uniref:hypothetical protein n=1 Tax=Nocardia sp. NPDC050712 TaxID=3155518 RepID=UPI0033CA6FC1
MSRLRAWWPPVLVLVLYLALLPVLAALSARQGFGSPDGTGPVYLAVSAAVLVLRLTLLIVVPAVVSYRVVAWGIARILVSAPLRRALSGGRSRLRRSN